MSWNRLITLLCVAAVGLLPTPLMAEDKKPDGPPPGIRPTGAHDKFARLEALAGKRGLKVFVIPIEGPIGEVTAALVRRSARLAREQRADLVVLDMNTPGGRVDSCQVICRELDALSQTAVTISFIRHWAVSGGALVSMACDFIVMRPNGSIGSAAPVTIGAEGAKALGEKYVSALRSDIRAWAEKKGHPPYLGAAMVDAELEIHEVRIGDRVEYLPREEIDRRSGRGDTVDVGSVVCREGKLLNLTAKEAARYGLSAETLMDMEALWSRWGLDVGSTERSKETWSESFVDWLSYSGLAGILMMIGVICLMVELKSPGLGLPMIVGVSCIGFVLFAKHLSGLAEAGEIVLILIGIGLLAAELFIIPGFGIAGVSGIVCVLAGLTLSFQNFTFPENAYQVDVLIENLFFVMGSLGGALIGLMCLVRFLPNVPMFRHLTLSAEQRVEDGYVVGAGNGFGQLAGQHGRVSAKLRPSGKVEINGKLYDVVCEGEFLDEGTPVVVARVNGNVITVERQHAPA